MVSALIPQDDYWYYLNNVVKVQATATRVQGQVLVKTVNWINSQSQQCVVCWLEWKIGGRCCQHDLSGICSETCRCTMCDSEWPSACDEDDCEFASTSHWAKSPSFRSAWCLAWYVFHGRDIPGRAIDPLVHRFQRFLLARRPVTHRNTQGPNAWQLMQNERDFRHWLEQPNTWFLPEHPQLESNLLAIVAWGLNQLGEIPDNIF
ncbi:hypothetical protein BC940DRAFT_334668 [Gongronella butleri]|nr:hypothetical protein BC940DRAFT_334668 [Gongronella butleri]